MSTTGNAVAIGVAAFVVAALVLKSKKSSAATAPTPTPPDDGDHIEPPPDRPPYTHPPTDQNPVGSYPGVQHFMLDRGGQLPDPVGGPSVGGVPFYVNRPPESVTEAAATFAVTQASGQYPVHVFSGSTAFVRDQDPSNPFGKTNVKMILKGGAWAEWTTADGKELTAGPVVFQAGPDGTWRRITPA